MSLALKMNDSEICGRKIRIQRSQENPKGTFVNRFSEINSDYEKNNFLVIPCYDALRACITLLGSATSREGRQKNFGGIQAKEKFYQRRKMVKQQKKFGLSTSKKTSSKASKKNNKKTSFKQKKK